MRVSDFRIITAAGWEREDVIVIHLFSVYAFTETGTSSKLCFSSIHTQVNNINTFVKSNGDPKANLTYSVLHGCQFSSLLIPLQMVSKGIAKRKRVD